MVGENSVNNRGISIGHGDEFQVKIRDKKVAINKLGIRFDSVWGNLREVHFTNGPTGRVVFICGLKDLLSIGELV